MVHKAGRFWLCGRFASPGCAELVSLKDSSCKHALLFFWPHHQNQWFPLSHLWPCWQLQIKKLTAQAHMQGSSGFSWEESPCSRNQGTGFKLFHRIQNFFPLYGTFAVTVSDVCLPSLLRSKQELYCRKLWIGCCMQSIPLCWQELSQTEELPRKSNVSREQQAAQLPAQLPAVWLST